MRKFVVLYQESTMHEADTVLNGYYETFDDAVGVARRLKQSFTDTRYFIAVVMSEIVEVREPRYEVKSI